MRKPLPLLRIAVLLAYASFSACGGSAENTNTAATNANTKTAATPAAMPAAAPAAAAPSPSATPLRETTTGVAPRLPPPAEGTQKGSGKINSNRPGGAPKINSNRPGGGPNN